MPEPPMAGLDDDDILEAEVARTIGRRLRDERYRLGLTLQGVADSSGLSLGMVSKIENAQTSPSLRTLARLGQALEMPLAEFFRGFEIARDLSLVRNGQGIEVVRPGTRHGYRYELLASPTDGETNLQAFLVTITEQGEAFTRFQHSGSEFIYMLTGRMTYRFGDEDRALWPGDSMYVPGTVQHGPASFDDPPVQLLSISIEDHTAGQGGMS